MEERSVIDLTRSSAETTDANATSIVKVLMVLGNVTTAAELAEAIDIKLGTLYNRLNKGKPWLASELVLIADYFDVDPAVFFQDPQKVKGELFRSR